MKTVSCKTKSKNYNIVIDGNSLSALSKYGFKKAFIITDDKVQNFCLNRLTDVLNGLNKEYRIIIIKNGERSKNIKTVEKIYNELNQGNITKSDIILSLGGGVVGDISGFAAATYLRGIRIIQIPTTLLAMVDSSIGGKCGVDTPYGKNLIGSIYQPEAVLIKPDFLKTLPLRQFRSGMAEVIKCGLIGNSEILTELEKKEPDYEKIIYLTAKFKAEIVEADENESNLRMILNFGHTIGHAVELLGEYRKYTHGEAVAIGMVFALKLSEKMLNLDKNITERAVKILKKYRLPLTCPYTLTEMIEIIKKDKKMRENGIRFILLKDYNTSIIENMGIEKLISPEGV